LFDADQKKAKCKIIVQLNLTPAKLERARVALGSAVERVAKITKLQAAQKCVKVA